MQLPGNIFNEINDLALVLSSTTKTSIKGQSKYFTIPLKNFTIISNNFTIAAEYVQA